MTNAVLMSETAKRRTAEIRFPEQTDNSFKVCLHILEVGLEAYRI